MWIESHAELRDHPKTDLLMELLSLTRRDAVGLLHFVWWRALTYAPTGDLSSFTDSQVARWADWDSDPTQLVSGLKTAGFLDERRQLHDWHDYAGRYVERREADAARKRAARQAATRTSPGRPNGPLPESGVPDHTGPNHTGPDSTPPPKPPSARGGGRTSRRQKAEKIVRAGECAGCKSTEHASADCPIYGAVFRNQHDAVGVDA